MCAAKTAFQFTLPCRERRQNRRRARAPRGFNSRSRVGSDSVVPVVRRTRFPFQFTLPCRERLEGLRRRVDALEFQFTLPCRERPISSRPTWRAWRFQFTLPCRERQLLALTKAAGPLFQFTLPCRERPFRQAHLGVIVGFNSRSRVGSDGAGLSHQGTTRRFNSRSRVGSDMVTSRVGQSVALFQFTLPCRERLDDGPDVAVLVRVSIHAPV